MCAKHQRRCPVLLGIREEALREWARAETLAEVRAAWSRLGGLTVRHRYGRRHFVLLARVRWQRPGAAEELAVRMQRRSTTDAL
jgi:hypothetical protein